MKLHLTDREVEGAHLKTDSRDSIDSINSGVGLKSRLELEVNLFGPLAFKSISTSPVGAFGVESFDCGGLVAVLVSSRKRAN